MKKLTVVLLALALIIPQMTLGATDKTYTVPAKKVTVKQAPKQKCHPSYSGCLRADASDYDCAKGKGDGPYYTGKVKVIGPDVFGLDKDKDGWGCE